MKLWRKIVILIMLLIFAAGLGIMLYPSLQGAITDHRIIQEAHEFLEMLETIPTKPEAEATEPTEPTEPTETEPVLYPELLNAMQSYNQQIWEEKQAGLCDPWSYEQPSFTLGDYGLEDEVFGVITIPRLQLEMPIYLGATYKHMADGAAHLSQTSLPIGGENTNCVIAGHRGWGGASYFRYITELEAGDEVIITNLWGELRYTVTETKIIDPNDVEEILIQQDRELLTLLTCHPYASGGKYRYVVNCERNQEMEVS
jgi:sortase A